jgi:hypothetical protein
MKTRKTRKVFHKTQPLATGTAAKEQARIRQMSYTNSYVPFALDIFELLIYKIDKTL